MFLITMGIKFPTISFLQNDHNINNFASFCNFSIGFWIVPSFFVFHIFKLLGWIHTTKKKHIYYFNNGWFICTLVSYSLCCMQYMYTCLMYNAFLRQWRTIQFFFLSKVYLRVTDVCNYILRNIFLYYITETIYHKN